MMGCRYFMAELSLTSAKSLFEALAIHERYLLERLLLGGNVVHADIVSVLRELQRDSSADALGGTCDDDAFGS